MSEDPEEILTLANALTRLTREGKVEWSETDQSGRYLYMGRNGGVTVSSTPSGMMANKGSGWDSPMNYQVELVNRDGRMINSKKTKYPIDSGDFIDPDARLKLKELFDAAEDAADEADKVVKGLLEELGDIDPFRRSM